MAIVYRIARDPVVTYAVWDGTVTADEFLFHVRRMTSDPEWPPTGRLHLSDLSTATVHASIDNDVLAQAADLFGQHPNTPNMRAAIVAGAEFQKAGAFERLTMRYPMFVFVFNTLPPACQWLGIDAGETKRILRSMRTEARQAADS